MKALVVMLLACQVAATAAAEPLGRLFFTPEQRAQLDKLRKQRPQATAPEPETADEGSVPAVVSYSGLVHKADGRPTVWVNNRPLYDDAHAAPGEPRARLHEDGSATVSLPQQGSVRLKVGQTAEVGSGRVAESYMRRSIDPGVTDHAAPAPSDLAPRLRRKFADERRFPSDGSPP